MFKFKNYVDHYQSVIDWNNVVRSEPPTIEEQTKICLSEVQEYFDAIRDNDNIEEMDALCDMFFTGAYLEELDPNNKLVSAMYNLVSNDRTFGSNILLECLDEVIHSNWSKVVLNPTAENIGRLLDTYTLTTNEYQGITCYVIKDENNKVMKPRQYEPPNIKGILQKYGIVA